MTGLQFERTKRNLTQEELAESVGLAAATIYRIETGITKNPIASTLLCVADAMGCPVGDLRKEYPDDDARTRITKGTSIVNDTNVLLAYKNATHSTFQKLGNILHLTHEGVRVACKRVPAHEQYVSLLADYEGMSVEELLAEYLPAG